jgi:hypothetical protein
MRIGRKLKLRAEEEQRQISSRALKGRATSLHDAISRMPNVGDDRDFESVDDLGRRALNPWTA